MLWLDLDELCVRWFIWNEHVVRGAVLMLRTVCTYPRRMHSQAQLDVVCVCFIVGLYSPRQESAAPAV